jgi:predicted aspartyl protease
MLSKEAKKVGRFSVEFEVANYVDVDAARRKTIKPEQVRRVTMKGVVDTGAARFVLPKSVVEQLGLPAGDKIKVRYADPRTAKRAMAEGAYVTLLGRSGTFTAVVEPKRKDALIGAIVLEDLDLLVDCVHMRIVPRDPKIAIYDIE